MARIVFFALLLFFVSMASIQAVNIESDTISDVQPVQGTPYRPQASKKGVLTLEKRDYRMTRTLFFALLLGAALANPLALSATPATTVDRECACTASKIWLDITVIIDVTEAMGDGIYNVAAQLISVFGQLNISQESGQFSRVALVTAGGQAVKVSDLTTYKNTEALINDITALQNGNDKTINIQAALKTASDIFADAGSQRNRKQVVLLYASAYNQGGYADPKETAIQMRDSGISIITVAYVQESESDDILKISELASPSFGFSNVKTKNLVKTIVDTFCQVNCFCRTNWAQFSDTYNTAGARKYGVCVRYIGIQASWFAANAIGCRNKGSAGSYLVTEFSATKHKFNKAYYTAAANQTGIASQAINYHIGLRTNVPKTTGYVWVQGTHKYVNFDTKGYHAWGAGYPNVNQGDCVTAKANSFTVQWENTNCYTDAQDYLCEAPSCDTDNYCDSIDDN
ncbi:hypothetical protein QR680_006549 [Steinernema hermaphroditum]|uniref:C-type lectin domain-containing protein n=1 Tax=Steinernema hermaphroditum TaxID=289476 RepID=A0AA39HX29_9BILA|nr:hypothetical protein QR680_006549 [Steinernema hermaphroditum]